MIVGGWILGMTDTIPVIRFGKVRAYPSTQVSRLSTGKSDSLLFFMDKGEPGDVE